ncbi:hypothetical protein ACHAPU_009052, partial [Fusarium lateritium]
PMRRKPRREARRNADADAVPDLEPCPNAHGGPDEPTLIDYDLEPPSINSDLDAARSAWHNSHSKTPYQTAQEIANLLDNSGTSY